MTAKFLLALGLVAAGIAQSGTVSHENECLPSAEFNIGGISLDSTIDEIEKLRGKPKTICVDNDLFVETLEYDDIGGCQLSCHLKTFSCHVQQNRFVFG